MKDEAVTFRAYLIDPFACIVREVRLRTLDGDIDLVHARELMRCQWIEAHAALNAGRDHLYLDEDANLREGNASFMCRLWPYAALQGRALWVGCDGEGGNCDPTMSLEYVAAHLAFEVSRFADALSMFRDIKGENE